MSPRIPDCSDGRPYEPLPPDPFDADYFHGIDTTGGRLGYVSAVNEDVPPLPDLTDDLRVLSDPMPYAHSRKWRAIVKPKRRGGYSYWAANAHRSTLTKKAPTRALAEERALKLRDEMQAKQDDRDNLTAYEVKN
jgi:hypothetical protein